MRVLGIEVRRIAASPETFYGDIGKRHGAPQLVVEAVCEPEACRVAMTDVREARTVAFGTGRTLAIAEARAQDDAVRRLQGAR